MNAIELPPARERLEQYLNYGKNRPLTKWDMLLFAESYAYAAVLFDRRRRAKAAKATKRKVKR